MRYLIILLAIIGFGFTVPKFFPIFYTVAFSIAGYGITYLLLASLGIGYVGLRVTK